MVQHTVAPTPRRNRTSNGGSASVASFMKLSQTTNEAVANTMAAMPRRFDVAVVMGSVSGRAAGMNVSGTLAQPSRFVIAAWRVKNGALFAFAPPRQQHQAECKQQRDPGGQ